MGGEAYSASTKLYAPGIPQSPCTYSSADVFLCAPFS